MTDSPRRYRLLNVAGRPLELHLTAGVVVLPAGGDVTCEESDYEVPQVQALRKSGALVIRTVEQEEPVPPAKPRRRTPAAVGRASGTRRKPSSKHKEAK